MKVLGPTVFFGVTGLATTRRDAFQMSLPQALVAGYHCK
jgi:hypothetical protein